MSWILTQPTRLSGKAKPTFYLEIGELALITFEVQIGVSVPRNLSRNAYGPAFRMASLTSNRLKFSMIWSTKTLAF